ncbi:MAG TPA: D-aminoacylase [Kiloniellales bacterium]|nr:D-aminoacylase [Kiloniellales bacterium]
MPRADTLIRGAQLYDGLGGAPVPGDLAIEGGRIAATGDLAGWSAAEEISADGLGLAPGFIDVHTHDDRAVLATDMACKVSQGVTSVVVGNCGISLAPLAAVGQVPPPLDLLGEPRDYAFPRFVDYVEALHRRGAAVNVAALIGHSTLRVGAMDSVDRPATRKEIWTMQEHLVRSLGAGAIGFSAGLEYAPSRAAPTEEVMALTAVLKAAGGIHTTHMRNEGDHVIQSMDEAFAIGRSADVPVVISHFKLSGPQNFGRSTETLAKFAEARGKQPLALDAYPYPAGSTVLKADYAFESTRVLITWSKAQPKMAGRYLDEIAREWGVDQRVAAERLQPAGAVYFSMDEGDVRRILAYPETMIGSDGLPHDAHPHPRLWGAFPRVLGHYAREEKLFTLEEALRRMTSLPAANFGFKDRGRLAEGAAADLVLFDPQTVEDRATFEEPTLPSAGIARTIVNGTTVWQDGQVTGERPGVLLRRQRTDDR